MRETMNQPIVKTGKFLYADSISVNIRIVQRDFRPGSGDDEDEQEYRDDLPGIWFEIQYGSPTGIHTFPAGGGYFQTLEEAMEVAEKSVNMIGWDR